MRPNPDQVREALEILLADIAEGTTATRYRSVINGKLQFALVAVGDVAVLFDDYFTANFEKTEVFKEYLK